MFTPVEQHFYRRQHEECAGTAMKVSINFLKAIDKTYSVDWADWINPWNIIPNLSLL